MVLGWLLRIIGGLLIVFGWFAYLGTFGDDALIAMQGNIVYAIIFTIVGLVVMFIGGTVGRKRK